MEKYTENRLLLTKGEHQVFVPKGTKLLGYTPVNTNEAPFKIVQTEDYLDYINYDLYINNVDVIVPKNNQQAPGIPQKIFEQNQDEEVIFAPKTHEIYLPYFVSALTKDGQYYENIKANREYPGYAPVSDKTYGVIDKLDCTVYKLYTNTVAVAVLIKNIDENIPGKPLIKKSK